MNLRDVRKKIKSIKNVKKITSAMQMVSAVKMRKAQEKERETSFYREGLTNMIAKLSKGIDMNKINIVNVDISLANKDLVIIISTNKGLAGSFNSNLFRFLLRQVNFEETDFIVVGLKATQFIGSVEGGTIAADFSDNNALEQVSALFNFMLQQYSTGEYRSVSVMYNKFISTLKSETVREFILPFDKVEVAHKQEEVSEKQYTELEYKIEPDPKRILKELYKSFLEQKIRGAIISSEAVEHSMRMMAMKAATDNASELVYGLTLLSNKLRQEKITNELLDMITAKESVG